MRDRRPLVVVTGAAGLVGGVLTARLASAYRMRLVDRLSLDDPAGLAIDLADLPGLEGAVAGADAVIHLAAAASVTAAWPEVLASNVVGTYHVFEAARAAGVPRVVFASTNHVVGMYERDGAPTIYEPGDRALLDHRIAARPDSLYGASKGFGELLGRYYSDCHSIRVVCLRLGTVLRSDDPTAPPPSGAGSWAAGPWERRIRGTWLSHRDCADLFRCAIEADVRFAIAYGVSDVPGRFWDLEEARRSLGFMPHDRWPHGSD